MHEGVVLACDFCGTDWDQRIAMIEGHRGSIICIDCLGRAIAEAAELCLVERSGEMKAWAGDPAARPDAGAAVVCWDCIEQADRAFARDQDTPWQRKT